LPSISWARRKCWQLSAAKSLILTRTGSEF